MCMTLETVRQAGRSTGECCSALCSVATDNRAAERWGSEEDHARTHGPAQVYNNLHNIFPV